MNNNKISVRVNYHRGRICCDASRTSSSQNMLMGFPKYNPSEPSLYSWNCNRDNTVCTNNVDVMTVVCLIWNVLFAIYVVEIDDALRTYHWVLIMKQSSFTLSILIVVVYITVFLYNDDEISIKLLDSSDAVVERIRLNYVQSYPYVTLRSRYAKFMRNEGMPCTICTHIRSREPSRVPVRHILFACLVKTRN
jgi:hypothetical protein